MPRQITIKNYDIRTGGSEDGSFLGLDMDGKHYIIAEDDYCKRSAAGRGGLVIPKTAYELVSYSEKTMTAKAREVAGDVLNRVAVEFHLSGRVLDKDA